MPSIENIAGVIGGSTGVRHIVVEPGRCTEVRHRMARCHACIETCPEGAIDVRDNRITIAPELCIGCGSCASECPTEALRTVNPTRQELADFVDMVADQVFGPDSVHAGSWEALANPDARIAVSTDADSKPYLEFACEHAVPSNAAARIVVPALPYVDETVLLHAAARGFETIALTCCNGPQCMKPTLAAVPDTLETARSLLAVAGIECKISLRRQKPPAEGEDTAKRKMGFNRKPAAAAPAGQATVATSGSGEYSRRGMLSDMASQATTIVAETAAIEIRERLGMQEEAPTIRQVLTDGNGNMRKFPMPHKESLLMDLFTLNPEPAAPVATRGFARVTVNADACRRCAMCANFCTTGALQGEAVPIGQTNFGAWRPAGLKNEEPQVEGSLTFNPTECVGCHLCEFACPLRCLKVEDELDPSELFELAPIDLLQSSGY